MAIIVLPALFLFAIGMIVWWNQSRLHVRRHAWFPADVDRAALADPLRRCFEADQSEHAPQGNIEQSQTRVHRSGWNDATAAIDEVGEHVRVSFSAAGTNDAELDTERVTWSDAKVVANLLSAASTRLPKLGLLGFTHDPVSTQFVRKPIGQHGYRVLFLVSVFGFMIDCASCFGG